jgi:hypothetical protein
MLNLVNNMTEEEIKKEINRRKNSQRAVKPKIKIYDYGGSYLGEPSKSKLESFQYQVVTLRTYRHDYRQFLFVRCQITGRIKIVVLRFAEDKINRLSCQLLEKWDSRYSFI